MDLRAQKGPRNGPRVEWRMPTGAAWVRLYEENEDFRLWFDNLARGSPTTAIERARVLYRFLGLMGWKLDELTEQIRGDRDRFEKRLMAFVGQQEKKGYAPGSIENYLKSVRSWANWHGVELVRRIKISNRTSTPTLDSEEVPTPQQVQDIRSAASVRGRICVGAVAYGGLRPEVLGHQNIADGLKLGDLPELDIESLKFRKVPTLVVVRLELSKAGHKYRTLLPQEACRDILAYLSMRRKMGDELTGDSPLVAVELSNKDKGWRPARGGGNLHIVAAVVSRDIRSAMRPMYSYRPYVLRSYFSTRLLMAVSDGILDNNYRIYWMGHQGQISARYSSNKALLPDDFIENMREAYNRCRPYLLGATISEEEVRRKQLLDTAKMLGFGEDKLARFQEILKRTRTVDDAVEEFRKLQAEEMIKVPREERLRKLGENSNGEHKVVDGEGALIQHLNQGWTLVRELNGGDRFLMHKAEKH